ncbi:MAG: transglycosylase SLT domain-containing protein [Candidatus Sumerlaeia bacterium]
MPAISAKHLHLLGIAAICFGFLAGAILPMRTALADEIFLKGRKHPIKGEVVGRKGKDVLIRPYSGSAVLAIPATKVERLESEARGDEAMQAVNGYASAGHYLKAIKLLRHEITARPDDKELPKKLLEVSEQYCDSNISSADAFLEQDQFEKAIALVKPVLDNVPEGPARDRANQWLADAYHARAKELDNFIEYDAAEDVLADGMAAGVQDPRMHIQLARIHLKRGRYGLAGNEFQIALIMDPQNAPAQKGLADARRMIRNAGIGQVDTREEAERLLAKARRLQKESDAASYTQEGFPDVTTPLSASERRRVAAQIARDHAKYDSIVALASRKHGVEVAWIKAIINAESTFRPRARSEAGAMGLMQLMDFTARELGMTNAYDPRQNIIGGTLYFSKQMERFNNNPYLALAAYNAGAGAVAKWGTIPPYSETQAYVQKCADFYRYFKFQ